MIAVIVLIMEIIMLGIVKCLGILDVGDIFASSLIIAFSVAFFISIQANNTIGKYYVQITLGYLARIVLLFFDIFGTKIHILPQSGNDSSKFYRISTELVLYGLRDGESNFTYLLYRVFRIIGINRLYCQFLLMLMSVLSIIVFIITIDKIETDERAKDLIIWIICLLPNFALLSSLFLRESIITLLITISIYAMVEWMLNRGNVFFVIAILSSLAACWLHSGCIGITIGCVVCLLIYDTHEKRIHTTIGGILLAVIIALGISFVFLRYGDALMGKFTGVENIADLANTNQLGGSTYSKYVGNSNTPINMIIYTLPRLVYFLFSPFPWQWRGLSDVIAFFFSGLYYIFIIYNAFRYIFDKKNKYNGMVIALLTIAFFCTFIFAWGVSNTGTATRHRDKMVCLYGIILSMTLGTTSKISKKKPMYLK